LPKASQPLIPIAPPIDSQREPKPLIGFYFRLRNTETVLLSSFPSIIERVAVSCASYFEIWKSACYEIA
jgi:hypothetical protein